MGWGTSADYEFADVFVNGSYFATLLDGDADAATQALHVNPILGAASDEFSDLGITLAAGQILEVFYGEVGANNGFRIESISVPEPTSISILGLAALAGIARRRRR